jgi:regulator of extracellular matrix RemA (YlzA/DUF370 family)
MYLHLGSDTVITYDRVVAVFDIDKTTVSRITKDYLTSVEKRGKIIDISSDIPKSFVICSDGKNNQTIFITQISPQTLLKRSERKYSDML